MSMEVIQWQILAMVTSDNLSGSDSGPNRIYTICSTYELQTILILNQKAVISDSARTHFNFETFYLFWILMMTLFSALTCLVTSLWRSEEYMYKIINVSSTYQPLKIPTFTKETTFFLNILIWTRMALSSLLGLFMSSFPKGVRSHWSCEAALEQSQKNHGWQ